MDPPPPCTTTTTTTTTATTTHKLRLMCSYGGQIISRSSTKSLYYAGGDTRIITVPPTTTTLSSLTTHLASALHFSNPFTLKYQLPSHDLDSLISLSTDDDLLIMLDEHHRLSPTPSRIRLFLFPAKPISESSQFNELKHPKTETWFADVLKSAKIMQKGGGAVGFGLEGQCEGNNEASGAESMILETNSSFGSTSSSVSLSNLPAKGPQVEELGIGLLDNKVKLSASESFTASYSDNSPAGATAVSHPQSGTCQEPAAAAAAAVPLVEDKTCYPIDSKSKILDAPIGVEMHKAVQFSGFPLSLQFDQPQVQFIHTTAPHYLTPNATGMMPVSSYYVMSSPVPQQQMYYQTNHPQPVYFVPVGHPYNLPMQSGLINPATIPSGRPPAHPNPSPPNPAQVAYKVASTSPVPETASQAFRTLPMPSSLVNVLHNEIHQQAGGLPQVNQQAGGLPQVNQQAQPIGITSIEAADYTNELDDDPVRVQIYKSQPPPPALPSQYPTMTKAAAVKLSEALAQLHTDNTKQQIRTHNQNKHMLD